MAQAEASPMSFISNPFRPKGKKIREIEDERKRREKAASEAEKIRIRKELIASVNSVLLSFASAIPSRVNAIHAFEKRHRSVNVFTAEQMKEKDGLLDALNEQFGKDLAGIKDELMALPNGGYQKLVGACKKRDVLLSIDWATGTFKVDPYSAFPEETK